MLEEQYGQAFSIMLKGKAAIYYYNRISGQNLNFAVMVQIIKEHFQTEENRQLYLNKWRETTFIKLIIENPTKNRLEVL